MALSLLLEVSPSNYLKAKLFDWVVKKARWRWLPGKHLQLLCKV